MVRNMLLILMMLSGVADWEMTSQKPNSKLYYSEELKTSKWVGYPDPNYVLDGGRLSYERIVKNEDGKDVTVKTYKEPIEIIADFKPESKVFGVEGNIERNAVKKFGGALKGFVWLDNIIGGGEVTLPFTAPHIFIATGDRLNPELTEISTDPNSDNYYEVVEGKTHVFVKSFSGIGGAAGAPPTLIAHYKMNENTSGDNAELVVNGDFASGVGWTLGDGWSIGSGVASCDGTQPSSSLLKRQVVLVDGKTYKIVFTLLNRSAGEIRCNIGWTSGIYRNVDGTYEEYLVHTGDTRVNIQATDDFIGDIDNVSVKLLAVEDSSGNDHDGLAQQDTFAISVAGKINTAFDFNGSSDYIEIADHDDFTPALTPFSISAWVYMHNASNFYIATKGVFNTDGEFQFFVHPAGDKLTLRYFDESIAAFIGRQDSAALSQNTWLHIVGTYDGGILSSGIKLYVNAIRVDDVDSKAQIFESVENLAAPVYIGRYDSTYANGLIDTPTFFSVELTPDEVKRLYNNSNGTEILAEVDPVISPRRSNTSPLGLRARYEFP